MINKHGGMTRHSGQLPRMVEVDEEGCQWAEAAMAPTEPETEEDEDDMEEEDDDDEGVGSPTSAAHLITSPPPPPTSTPPPAVGALTPPTQFTDDTASLIAAIHEDFFELILI